MTGPVHALVQGVIPGVLTAGAYARTAPGLAAVIISTSAAVVASTLSPSWSELTPFAILLAVRLLRPQGLFGSVEGGAL